MPRVSKNERLKRDGTTGRRCRGIGSNEEVESTMHELITAGRGSSIDVEIGKLGRNELSQRCMRYVVVYSDR